MLIPTDPSLAAPPNGTSLADATRQGLSETNGSGPLGPTDPHGPTNDMTMITDIVVPPMVALGVLVLALMVYSIVSQPAWWSHNVFRRGKRHTYKIGSSENVNTPEREPAQTHQNGAECGEGKRNCSAKSRMEFITWEDKVAMSKLHRYQNAPHHLIRVAMPTIMSLAFCPLTLFLYPPMAGFFWPNGTMPNVNDAIASFLTPAGLVYAIAFGFALQEAQNRQSRVEGVFSSLENTLREVLLLVKSSDMRRVDRQQIRHFLKQESMLLVHMITHRDYEKRDIWKTREGRYDETVKVLKSYPVKAGHELDSEIQRRLLDKVLAQYTQMMDSQNIVVPTMQILHWIFLELLGFFAFFGVLLIQAGSPRLQLVMCMLTVFSISMFCYILADLDQPHHGVFRVNLRILATFLHQIEGEWKDDCAAGAFPPVV